MISLSLLPYILKYASKAGNAQTMSELPNLGKIPLLLNK